MTYDAHEAKLRDAIQQVYDPPELEHTAEEYQVLFNNALDALLTFVRARAKVLEWDLSFHMRRAVAVERMNELKAELDALMKEGREQQHRVDTDHRPFEEWGKYHGCGTCDEFERDKLRLAASETALIQQREEG
jgi:hypothetical protein